MRIDISGNNESVANKVVSLSALAIAILALFVSLWEGYENREHNRLIVRPILGIEEKITNSNPTFRGIILSKKRIWTCDNQFL